MSVYLDDGDVVLHLGDCVETMAAMPAESVDAIVTDPPYGLEFMGKEWDSFTGAGMSKPGIGDRRTEWPSFLGSNTKRCRACGLLIGHGGSPCRCEKPEPYNAGLPRIHAFQAWCETWAAEALRVLKPGGHMLTFGGTRTFHRLTCAIEDAGFEIRDCLSWLYGSGFPKSLDVSKAIDKAAGAERGRNPDFRNGPNTRPDTKGVHYMGRGATDGDGLDEGPATPEAAKWQGWGTALKPAWEPIVVARKPLGGTVAANVLATGCGALNIDGCRIGMSDADAANINGKHIGMDVAAYNRLAGSSLNLSTNPMPLKQAEAHALGRWPANVVLDEAAAAQLDAEVGERPSGRHSDGEVRSSLGGNGTTHGAMAGVVGSWHGDTGGPSRFFYTAKASTAERDGATHPTVKPLALMRWCVRLVTPPGGVVLDCFAGSGTTLLAARDEGFRAIGIEREEEYARMIVERYRRRFDPAAAEWKKPTDDGLLSLFGDAA